MKKDDEIQVSVISYGANRNLVMYYVDPISGKRISRSTGTKKSAEAERVAGEWERELRAGAYQSPSKTTWATFRERYDREHLATLASGTRITANVALDTLERVLNPDRLVKLTSTAISKFQADLRAEGMKDTTIARNLRHVKAALAWAVKMGLMAKRPDFIMPKRIKGQTFMKGRPITGEEFERMLLACDKERANDAEQWKRLLTGLWLSGLRISEALTVSWEFNAPFAVDLSGRRPVFRICAEAHKGNRDTLLPATPDFIEWLLATFPEGERHGPVFRISTNQSAAFHVKRVIKIISDIGERAGVIVSTTERQVRNKATGKLETVIVKKYASAHDLRRAFGTRWAPKVKPATLQLLMRHADISTTLKYYVAQDANDVADELWANYAPATEGGKPEIYNTFYNKGQKAETK